MLLLISAWWLLPAFIVGGFATFIICIVAAAIDYEMPKPKPKWGEDPDDKPSKIYHSQEAVKAIDGRLTKLNMPLDEYELGN